MDVGGATIVLYEDLWCLPALPENRFPSPLRTTPGDTTRVIVVKDERMSEGRNPRRPNNCYAKRRTDKISRVPYPKEKKRDPITKTPLSVRLSPGCIS
ncbi:hypothetical protein EVAR_94384_1 [Eumeta japonica]|uniref:Uncharacterized protein n=1 Tax=Eumeta variegata TaxID=151549 RepID=A0A4C1TPY9_EUMVA|nr:hypothetical protein EVAR_94384_1 [Eumeta japonica]